MSTFDDYGNKTSMQFLDSITVTSWWARWRLQSLASWLFAQPFVQAQIKKNMSKHRITTGVCDGNPSVIGGFTSQKASNAENGSIWWRHHEQSDSIACCPASRTTLVATRFRVAVICPIIQVPHCIRVFFYFVWFVFINHIFQFYYELCTYCNILDIYLS